MLLLPSCEGTSPSAAQRGAFRHRPPTLGSSSSSSYCRYNITVLHISELADFGSYYQVFSRIRPYIWRFFLLEKITKFFRPYIWRILLLEKITKFFRPYIWRIFLLEKITKFFRPYIWRIFLLEKITKFFREYGHIYGEYFCLKKWILVNRLADTRGWGIRRASKTHISSSPSHGEIISHFRLFFAPVRTCSHLFRVEIIYILEIQDRKVEIIYFLEDRRPAHGRLTRSCTHIHGTVKEKTDWKSEFLRNIAQMVPIGMCMSVHFILLDACGDV
jgi:hypothetical protein